LTYFALTDDVLSSFVPSPAGLGSNTTAVKTNIKLIAKCFRFFCLRDKYNEHTIKLKKVERLYVRNIASVVGITKYKLFLDKCKCIKNIKKIRPVKVGSIKVLTSLFRWSSQPKDLKYVRSGQKKYWIYPKMILAIKVIEKKRLEVGLIFSGKMNKESKQLSRIR
jgi:hypothetical protein